MQRGIVVYLILFVVIAIVAAYFYVSGGSKSPVSSTTTAGNGTVTTAGSTTTVQGGTSNSTTTTSTTSTVFISGCVSRNATVAIANGNFATGTWADWNVTGPGFGLAPQNKTKLIKEGAYYGNTTNPWGNYNGTFFASNFKVGVGLQAGNLTSNAFNVSQLYLNFKLISSQNALLYVQILRNGTPVITTHYNTYVSPPGAQDPQSTFVNASIPLGTLLCQKVSIRLVAGVTGLSSQGNGYLAAGDFYLSRSPAKNLTQPVNQTFSS